MTIASPMIEPRPTRGWAALPRLARFFIVGGINTVFGYSAYAALLFVGFHYAAAAFIGTVAGVLFNYFTTGRFVFEQVARGGLLVRFVVVYAVLYGFNVAALAVLQNVTIGAMRLGPYAAGLVLIVPMALLSYVLMRRYVFGGTHVAD